MTVIDPDNLGPRGVWQSHVCFAAKDAEGRFVVANNTLQVKHRRPLINICFLRLSLGWHIRSRLRAKLFVVHRCALQRQRQSAAIQRPGIRRRRFERQRTSRRYQTSRRLCQRERTAWPDRGFLLHSGSRQ